VRVREEPFDKAHEIAKAAGVPYLLTETATLISCDDARAFLEACRAARMQVLGVEGFDLAHGARRPDMGAILDLSEVDDANSTVDEALTFAAQVCREGLMFEFQLVSSSEGAARADPETVLGSLVVGCIQTRDHPVIEERDEAVGDLSLVLEDVVRKRIGDDLSASFDGIRTFTVESDGEQTLHIVGAFYVLETIGAGHTGHRMLPLDAHLTVEPGAVSTVQVGGRDSLFEMPRSARQFVRGIESARWRHRLELRLR
jgi:hypothetical protein